MNVALFKFGKSIKYNFNLHLPIGGDNEAPAMFYALAKAFPQHEFWIVSKTDYYIMFGDKGILPNLHTVWNPNVNPDYDVFKSGRAVRADTYEKNPENYERYFSYVIDSLARANVKIDFAIAFGGVNYGTTLENICPHSLIQGQYLKTRHASIDIASFITKWLNESMVSYVVINTDVRHCGGRATQDLVNIPLLNLSQANRVFRFSHSRYFYPKDVEHFDIPNFRENYYSGAETIHMMVKRPLNDDVNRVRNTKMLVIMNQGLTNKGHAKPKRYADLEKYVLNGGIDCSIYGVWDEEFIKDDSRFKGTVHPDKLKELFTDTKYTVCISVENGWITAKFTEMCDYGVIPFVSDNYGTDIGDTTYIPDFLRIHDSKELLDKISMLESDNDMYLDLRKKLTSQLDDMYTGEYVFSRFDKLFKEHSISFDMSERHKFTKPIFDHFVKDYAKSCPPEKLPKYFQTTIVTKQPKSNLDGLF